MARVYFVIYCSFVGPNNISLFKYSSESSFQDLWTLLLVDRQNWKSNSLSTLTDVFHRTFPEFVLHRKCILNYLGIFFVFYLYVARNLTMLCIIHTLKHTHTHPHTYSYKLIYPCNCGYARFMQSSVSLQGYYRLIFVTPFSYIPIIESYWNTS